MTVQTVDRIAADKRPILAAALNRGDREAVGQLSREKLGLAPTTPILDAAKENPDDELGQAVEYQNRQGTGGGG